MNPYQNPGYPPDKQSGSNQTSGSWSNPTGNQNSGSWSNPAGNQNSSSWSNPAGNQNSGSWSNPAGNQNSSSWSNPADGQTSSNPNAWMNNPALGGIDPAKLQMLTSLASQAQGKNQNELLPFLMAAASQSKSNNMSFQPDEIDTIINVMKLGKSPQEIQRIDQICSLIRQFRRFNS